jgi:myosin heavy subunit
MSNIVDPAIRALDNPSSVVMSEANDTQTLEILGHIDEALNSCASHLASLQKVATRQIDELKVIADTLQHPSIPEAGLNINTLMESLTAALEPMKAIGELVPALDRLVSISSLKDESTIRTKLSEQQLVLSLAEQLAAGTIDASTFKAACQAIFPDYDLNGLLHQLSELLGEQQLSGELFQVSFAALQSGGHTNLSPFNPPADAAELPSWDNNEDGTDAQSEMLEPEPLVSEREEQLERELLEKERELEEFKEQLDQRWQQLNGAYEELRVTLDNRETVLQSKEEELSEKIAELAAKDSENKQLRAQMEELRDQTKEMVADLQKQLAQKHAEEKAIRTAKTKAAASQPGFFELFSTSQPQIENEQNETGIADNAINSTTVQPTNANVRPTNPQPMVAAPNTIEHAPSAPQVAQTAPTHSGFASPSSSFVSSAGSYGSGVRAQVFEVIVRQALAGAHWREICAVPMQINNISPEEVELEVKRRQALLKK